MAIYHAINGDSVAAANVKTVVTGADTLAVFGIIVPDTGKAAFTSLRQMQGVTLSQPDARGTYAIQLLDAQGGVLLDHPFTAAPLHSHSGDVVLDVGEVVSFVASAAQIRIVKTAGGQVLASQAISAHLPSVSGVVLQGAPSPVVGNVTLGWNASDPDGDSLTFDIYYSHDGGASFLPLQLGITGTRAQIDSSKLGGGNGIFRIVASDGVHTVRANSGPFTMANKPPQPHILTPGDGTHIHYGQLINFSGEAEDFQDGGVSGASLVWRNQQGAALGTGPLLSLTDLAVGSNHITLTATNKAGLSSSASITVIVDDDLNLPGPTFSVGPTQINWHVTPGTTQPQMAQVSIANSGNGSLTWTARSDAAWLKLSVSSGSVPARLTLTADPSGFVDGTTATAHVQLTEVGGSGQTISIPVSLTEGDVWNNPPGGRNAVYLPLVRR
jgi:hypothetical protein